MNRKNLFRKILYYISVPKCVLCKETLDIDDLGLCKSCSATYKAHKQRNCSRCAKILSECSCSSEYLAAHGIKKVTKVFRYSKQDQALPSNYLIYSLKQDNRDDVLSFLAEEMANSIKNSFEIEKGKYIVTNVPRRKNAIVKFGFDHAAILAKKVSKILKIEYIPMLISKSKTAQKSVIGEERHRNVRFDYKSKKDLDLKGYTVLLVDDIITTGASMSSCATLIKAFRPKQVIGSALGIAYKDSTS